MVLCPRKLVQYWVEGSLYRRLFGAFTAIRCIAAKGRRNRRAEELVVYMGMISIPETVVALEELMPSEEVQGTEIVLRGVLEGIPQALVVASLLMRK